MELPEDETASTIARDGEPISSDDAIDAFAERHSLPRERAMEILEDANGDEAAADESARNFTARL
jgi:NACalpha-BTF3-like transcription factor